MNKTMDAQASQYQQLIAKCWADEAFKERLLADPAATLKQEGWQLQDGRTITVVADTEQVVHLVIPAQSEDVSDQELAAVAGGMTSEEMLKRSQKLKDFNGPFTQVF